MDHVRKKQEDLVEKLRAKRQFSLAREESNIAQEKAAKEEKKKAEEAKQQQQKSIQIVNMSQKKQTNEKKDKVDQDDSLERTLEKLKDALVKGDSVGVSNSRSSLVKASRSSATKKIEESVTKYSEKACNEPLRKQKTVEIIPKETPKSKKSEKKHESSIKKLKEMSHTSSSIP